MNKNILKRKNNAMLNLFQHPLTRLRNKSAMTEKKNHANPLIMLIMVLTICLSISSAWAQGGTTGPLTWQLTGTVPNMTLTISGEGAMPDYESSTFVPWYPYIESINTVVVENGVTTIGRISFFNCSNITSITIPNSVTTIGYGAFWGCSALTAIAIPNSVTTIGDVAFGSCSGLTAITIPNSVTTIGDVAFDSCSGLTAITIPNSVTTIGDNAFNNYSGLTSINVESGNNNYSSENGVLFNKNKDTLICYPGGKTGAYAIPNSVITIGDRAFLNCSGLTSIIIPNSVITVGDSAFDNCSGLTSINVESGNNNYSSEDGILFDKAKTRLIRYPNGKTDVTYTIPNGVKNVGRFAFESCTILTSITIPNSVITIEGAAFAYCTTWASLTIPNSVKTIGPDAFRRCDNLTSIIIPNSVDSIGPHAFHACKSLNSITMPNGITTIEDGVFYNCSALISITIPSGITTIGSQAFGYCTALASVTIPSSVTTIGNGAFGYCTALASVTIPSSVTTIAGYAFNFCTALAAITNLGLVPVEINTAVFEEVNQSACTLTVATSAISAYQSAEVWKEFNIVGGGLLVNPVSNNSEYGYTTGNGLYEANATATVTAVPLSYNKFVNWTKDGEVVSTDNPYSFTVTEDVELVANFEEGVGIEELRVENGALRVYPNPTREELRIETSDMRLSDITIYDMMGRMQKIGQSEIGQSEIVLDVSHLPTGIYFLRVGEKTVKFVKQ
jgi:hypothetical protein